MTRCSRTPGTRSGLLSLADDERVARCPNEPAHGTGARGRSQLSRSSGGSPLHALASAFPCRLGVSHLTAAPTWALNEGFRLFWPQLVANWSPSHRLSTSGSTRSLWTDGYTLFGCPMVFTFPGCHSDHRGRREPGGGARGRTPNGAVQCGGLGRTSQRSRRKSSAPPSCATSRPHSSTRRSARRCSPTARAAPVEASLRGLNDSFCKAGRRPSPGGRDRTAVVF